MLAYEQLRVEEVLKKLGVTLSGLPLGQTVSRLKKYGPNRLPDAPLDTRIRIFFAQFRNVLIYILLAASVISFVLREFTDMIVILVAVFVNVFVGFFQEYKAQTSLQSLRQVLSDSATVIRDGKPQTIDAEQVVPGDLLRLSAGEKVAADARLVELEELEVNEASLTGESEPVRKVLKKLSRNVPLADRVNMVYLGTVVTRGRGLAVVTATGLKTEIGKIASLLEQTHQESTPLQIQLSRLAKTIGGIVLVVCAVLLWVGVLRGVPWSTMITTAVAIAVSAIPEGLVISVTVVLAIGMQRILERKGLVRELLAAETLGSTDVICTDKTGTLTEGHMRVVSMHTLRESLDFSQNLPRRIPANILALARTGVLCNDATIENPADPEAAWVVSGNLTDRSLLIAGLQLGLRPFELQSTSKRIGTIPFDSERKWMATLHQEGEAKQLYVKGAPDRILPLCSRAVSNGKPLAFTEQRKKELAQRWEEMNEQGFRTLAVAFTEFHSSKLTEASVANLTFMGFLVIEDPLRATSAPTIREARAAGIGVVMVTGDHGKTALHIARQLGLSTKISQMIEGTELERMSDVELPNRIEHVSVFSRVTPQDKIRIIQAFQTKGHVVAMTGDGVNDAPALKKADIGVALGSGTQVAKDASDLVLLNDDFSTIVAAVREGRVIFENIKKITLYLLSDSFAGVVLVILSLIVGLPLPVTATQILWINLTTDVIPPLALILEPGESRLMQDPPRKKHSPILDRKMLFYIVAVSLLIGSASLGVFQYTLQTGGSLDQARTIAFMTLGVATILYIFSVRSLHHSMFSSVGLPSRRLLIAVFVALLLQVATSYAWPLQLLLRTVPLGLSDWALVIGISVAVVAFFESTKVIFRIAERHPSKHAKA